MEMIQVTCILLVSVVAIVVADPELSEYRRLVTELCYSIVRSLKLVYPQSLKRNCNGLLA